MPQLYSAVGRFFSRLGRMVTGAGSRSSSCKTGRPADAAVRRAALESLENRQLFAVSYDAAGFTAVTPGAGDRVVYVSTSQGSDNNSGLSAGSPVRSIAVAKSLVRSGTGDQMLLKRGDTFYEPLGVWTKGGRSASEPMVIGSYGSGNRPVVATGSTSAMTLGSSSARFVNNLVIQGIKFYAHTRDPGTSGFTGTHGNEGLRLLAGTSNLLLEDVAVDSYTTNITVSGYFGSMSGVKIRRSVITDAYNTNGHAQGLYAEKVSNLTVEDSVFDNNGRASVSGGQATIYNHNLYIKENVDGFVARGNLISNASSHGLQARSGGTIENNAFVNNPIHMSFGLVNGAPVRAGGVGGRVTGNLFQGGGSINGSVRGWALEVSNVRAGAGTTIARNVFKDVPANSGYAISLNICASNPNGSQAVGINDLTIEDNVISNWTTGIYVANALVTGGWGPSGLRNVTIRNNDIQRTQKPTVLYAGDDFSASQIKLSGNRYNQVAAGFPNALVNTGGPASRWSEWAPGRDFNSAETWVSYPDASRTAGTYASRIGVGSNDGALIWAARQQAEGQWRPQLLGSALADFVADGFGSGTAEPSPAPAPVVIPSGAGPIGELINSATDSKIATLTDGYTIDLSRTGSRLNVRAVPPGTAGSIAFRWNGRVVRTESFAPYTIGGDSGSDYLDWTPAIGAHTLEMLQYSGAGGTGSLLATTRLRLNVVA